MATATVESVEFLGTFEKTPAEVLDHKFFFGDWLKIRSDTVSTFSVLAENWPADLNPVGLTISSQTLDIAGTTIRFMISDGIALARYKVTVTVNTVGGLVKQAAILVRVKVL